MTSILAIAGNEIRIGIRNRWVILTSLVLCVFALLLVLLGSAPGGATKADGLSVIVASLATLSVYLIPLLALLLAFDAIAGEIDRGTLQVTLATQVSRGEVILGKFIGHLTVLAFAVMLGFGIAGGSYFIFSDGSEIVGLIDLARLIVTSIALGGAFIAIGYLASVTVRQAGTAAALVVTIWLFSVVLYDLALLGGLLASVDGVFAKVVFPYLLLANPADAFRVFNMAAIDNSGVAVGLAAGDHEMPVAPELAIFSPLLWMGLALVASTFLLKRVQP